MVRFLLITIICFGVLGSNFALAKTPVSGDLNHQGWYEVKGYDALSRYKSVEWQKVSTDCVPCQSLVQQYNFAMREVFDLRTRIKMYQEARNQRGETNVEMHGDGATAENTSKKNVKKGKELEASALRLAEILRRAQVEDEEKKKYDGLLQEAENRAQKLRESIADCEKQCKGDVKKTDIKIGGEPRITGSDPKKSPPLYTYKAPKWWKGPFDSVCWKCEKLAAELNTRIPNEVEWRQREIEMLKRAQDNGFATSEEYSRLSKLNSELHWIEAHYKKTLKMYNDCIKTCKGKKTACTYPKDSTTAIVIGPNSEVGSGAAMADKIEGKAKGAAMGALNSVLGGSGVSLGGGGKNKEPKMDKDPTSGAFQDLVSKHPGLEHMAGVEADGRFIMVDDELVASVKLDDVPGDGTFHAVWLEDGQGNIILPRRYLLIDLYRDWKLSVWWTYDRWVNGQHVEHDEGDSMTVGTDYLGTLALFEGAKGIAKSIWSQLGFGTAVKGAKHIGAVFPASVASGPCPLKLVAHVSLPKEDPVVTQGLVMNIDIPSGGDAETQVAPAASEFDKPAQDKKSNNDGARKGESKGAKRVRERSNSHND